MLYVTDEFEITVAEAKTSVVAKLLQWTGPLACLVLFSVGLVDKVSYEILEKLVTYIIICLCDSE